MFKNNEINECNPRIKFIMRERAGEEYQSGRCTGVAFKYFVWDSTWITSTLLKVLLILLSVFSGVSSACSTYTEFKGILLVLCIDRR